jgi:hypothetical protein
MVAARNILLDALELLGEHLGVVYRTKTRPTSFA